MTKLIKQFGLLALIFIGAPALWASTIFWIPTVSEFILKRSGKCETAEYTNECNNIIATYGATGDIFGIVTSLFTGLALFAVAATLWADTRSRREGRKPLVISCLDDDSIILDSPRIENGREITLHVTLTAINETSETALNVSIDAALNDGGNIIPLPKKYLKVPLNGGAKGSVTLNHKISGTNLLPFLSSLTEDSRHVNLDVKVQYQSLEDVKWSTSATYELRCTQAGQRRKLNAVRANNGDFEELWANDAAVALDITVKDGSWSHKKI